METAENEKEHAKLWFRELGGISNTIENMKAAVAGKTANGLISIREWPPKPGRKG
ncbi:hypothetical protein UF75_1546 [Desulfosporosinus sp. I2]|nr:hypothetical protein UF75_1546 [Desulfosporosinus sp. I2]